MNNNTSRKNALHLATVLTFSGFITGPVSAMAEQDTSLNFEMRSPVTETDAKPSVKLLKSTEPGITELPDKLTRVFGRTDNENDKVHYSFTSIRGQRVMIYNLPTRAQGPDWNVEYKIDKDWIQVPPSTALYPRSCHLTRKF